jgi:hypothetical protein
MGTFFEFYKTGTGRTALYKLCIARSIYQRHYYGAQVTTGIAMKRVVSPVGWMSLFTSTVTSLGGTLPGGRHLVFRHPVDR